MKQGYQIHIEGRVQGVGFRPFVYQLATRMNCKGYVENRTDGVWIHIWDEPYRVEQFTEKIRQEAPTAAWVKKISTQQDASFPPPVSFTIQKSQKGSGDVTDICPDIGVCDNCLNDMQKQPHRLSYPFINCTHCGPRFSIIRELPYDRPRTSMSGFPPCQVCGAEYSDIADRRFHAQPVACWSCGPVYYDRASQNPGSTGSEKEWKEQIHQVINLLISGKILAIQGIGGYHLVCDATHSEAIRQLRERKHRDGKPFAVLMKNLETIQQYCQLNAAETEWLNSWRKPVVILREKQVLNPMINQGLGTLGVMLPYTPLHHQLFNHSNLSALVCTSGNVSDEPIVIDPSEAEKTLSSIADGYLHSNRPIVNRTDDSVVRLAGNLPLLIRRSRGFVPEPISIPFQADRILALGGELKNTFCIGRGNEAILSQHIGDLKNYQTLTFYEETIRRFCKLFHFTPEQVVCDLHPDYLSSEYARTSGLPLLPVQHHHAHVASCMAENLLDEPVIGIAWDGTGMGTDGTLWGSEFFVADYMQFRRFSHFLPMVQPGGDLASQEPWRMALSYIQHHLGGEEVVRFPALANLPTSTREQVLTLCQMGDPIKSSGAGRLFDAVAAMTGVCLTNTFEAEAPIRLEEIIDPSDPVIYPFTDEPVIGFGPMIDRILKDITNQVPASIISCRFHRTLVQIIVTVCQRIKKETGVTKVVLSGGSFQNGFLLSQSIKQLHKQRFQVYHQKKAPPNDGGISLGQLLIASKQNN